MKAANAPAGRTMTGLPIEMTAGNSGASVFDNGHATRCAYCCTLPGDVNIPTLRRLHELKRWQSQRIRKMLHHDSEKEKVFNKYPAK